MEAKTRPFLWCVLILAFWGARALGEEEGQEVKGPLPWHVQDADVFLRRIVSAATGQPIPHATVKLYAEVPHPVPGPRPPTASGRGDADGWVRIRRDDLDPELLQRYGDPTWAYVEAAGYGPNAASSQRRTTSDQDLELRPATELRVTLRDPADRPIPGVRVAWFLGCGHTPDVRQAVTDDTGTARLLDVQDQGYGQIWPLKDGYKSWYVTDYAWRPWERPRSVVLPWGTRVGGRVLQHDGTPAINVAVGSPWLHRGPWTLTDETGHFVLLGTTCRPGDSCIVEPFDYFVSPDGAPHEPVRFAAPLPGRSVIVTLPVPGQEPKREETARLVVDAKLDGWRSDEALEVVLVVVACRAGDGRTREEVAEGTTGTTIDVPPGTYDIEVRAETSDGATCARARTRAVVSSSGGRSTVTLPQPARIVLNDPDSDAGLFLLAGGEERLLPELNGDQVFLVSRDEPLLLRIDQSGRRKTVPIDVASHAPGDAPMRVVVPRAIPLTVQARLSNEAGEPVAGWLGELDEWGFPRDEEWRDASPSERPTTVALSGSDVALVAWPEDEMRYQPVMIDVQRLDAASGTTVDLGAIAIPRRRPGLRVEDPTGQALPDPEVTVTRGPRQERLAPEVRDSDVIFDPWLSPGLLVEGAVVRTDAFGMPWVQTLVGPGPWVLRPPAGRLVVDIGADDPATLAAIRLHIDGRAFVGHAFRPVDGKVVVGALSDGEHEAIVEVPGHPPRRLVFAIRYGESRTWKVLFR